MRELCLVFCSLYLSLYHKINMNDNIKIGIGFLIPASAIIAFIISIYTESFLFAGFVSILGLLLWFLYSAIMQTSMPSVTGNIIILFGVLLSTAIFLSFGVKRNMFGGYELVPEGGAGSAILLLIIVLVGILFRTNAPPTFVQARAFSEKPLPASSKGQQASPQQNEGASIENDHYEVADYSDYIDYYGEGDEEDYYEEDYYEEDHYEDGEDE
mgnify:FL=1